MPLFTISIGQRGAPREVLQAEAPDSMTAFSEHLHLAQPGERLDVAPVRADDAHAVDLQVQLQGYIGALPA